MVWKDWQFSDEIRIYKDQCRPKLYFKVVDDGLIILLLYVDDLFLIGVENLIS
jgi:hypothetical protein